MLHVLLLKIGLLLLLHDNIHDLLDFFFCHLKNVPLAALVIFELDDGIDLLLLFLVEFEKLFIKALNPAVACHVDHFAKPPFQLVALAVNLLHDVYVLPLNLRVQALRAVIKVDGLLAQLRPLLLELVYLHFLVRLMVFKETVSTSQPLVALALGLKTDVGDPTVIMSSFVADYVRFAVKFIVATCMRLEEEAESFNNKGKCRRPKKYSKS